LVFCKSSLRCCSSCRYSMRCALSICARIHSSLENSLFFLLRELHNYLSWYLTTIYRRLAFRLYYYSSFY
jgi:hypothetical protein